MRSNIGKIIATPRFVMRYAGYLIVSASLLWVIMIAGMQGVDAGDVPTERTDVLPLAVIAGVETLLGEDTVILTGWAKINSNPSTAGDRQVLDLHIEGLELIGAGGFGAVSVTERGSSTGQIIGMPGEGLFPGEATVELFLELEILASPIGDLVLHNQTGLSLAPAMGEPITSWPPMGIVFETPGAIDCVPLFDESKVEPELDICINSMELHVAPGLPAYSVSREASRFHPADILVLTPKVAESGAGQLPYVDISCLDLGLTTAGCHDIVSPDNVNALAFGQPSQDAAERSLDFSVAPDSLGVEESAVAIQNLCPPAQPGLSPEPESDIFRANLDGTNVLRFDGNGPVGACESAFPLGLLESFTARDDLNALAFQDAAAGQRASDAMREGDLYFSLDAASPSLAALDFSPADILRATEGSEPTVFASSTALGLQPGDDIDGLCLSESGDGVYSDSDSILFSLAPGSPTLATIGAGPGDVLRPGSPPRVAYRAPGLGLIAGAGINALDCGVPLFADRGAGDVNCDGTTNSIDALLVLQHIAGLLDTLLCPAEADVNGGGIDSKDATLILQFEARLLLQLPV